MEHDLEKSQEKVTDPGKPRTPPRTNATDSEMGSKFRGVVIDSIVVIVLITISGILLLQATNREAVAYAGMITLTVHFSDYISEGIEELLDEVELSRKNWF